MMAGSGLESSGLGIQGGSSSWVAVGGWQLMLAATGSSAGWSMRVPTSSLSMCLGLLIAQQLTLEGESIPGEILLGYPRGVFKVLVT